MGLKERVMELTDGKGVDIVYEVVGGKLFLECCRCTKIAGGARVLVIGFACGEIPKYLSSIFCTQLNFFFKNHTFFLSRIPANLPLIKGFSIVGVRAGEQMRKEPALVEEMLQNLQKWVETRQIGALAPVLDDVFDICDFKNAFSLILERKVKGKVVLDWQNLDQSKL